MLNGRNLVVDTFSEVYDLLKPWITHEFWDISTHEPIHDSVYVIGRKQFVENTPKILAMLERSDITVIFDNAAEGSWTLVSQLQMMKLDDRARSGEILVIGGGEMPEDYQYVRYDHFLIEILNYTENLSAMSRLPEIYQKNQKPYKFLFLNGRVRPHRKYLYEKLKRMGLLDQCIWTMLDSRPAFGSHYSFRENDINVMTTVSELRYLDSQYEVSLYRNNRVDADLGQRTFIKNQLFNNEWGEIYLEPAPYIDTYFSLVTETVCEYSHSFRTEKLAKVLAQGHPWIVAANPGFYRDLRNLGFKTFDGIIDESFDEIQDHQTRMDRILALVQDLCSQDLDAFQQQCRPICEYNQQFMYEFRRQHQQQFLDNFWSLINQCKI